MGVKIINRNGAYEYIVNYYGTCHQLGILQEECAELIQAVSKYLRSDGEYAYNSRGRIENIVEEIADVEIMLSQIIIAFNIAERVENAIGVKLERQMNILAEERAKELAKSITPENVNQLAEEYGLSLRDIANTLAMNSNKGGANRGR